MISIKTVFDFLFFRAGAIREIANSRWATMVGFLFVVSAGFAREYDGEYLLAEPWHLLIPAAASLIGCLSLVILIYLAQLIRAKPRIGFAETFLAFLNVYWMTAPLAWVYAIPVERFLSPENATRVNMFLLAIVAIWRVALIVRCTQVLFRTRVWEAIFIVLLFSDILVLTAISLVPGPIFLIMGGVRLTESEQLILAVRNLTFVFGFGTMLAWIIGYLVLLIPKDRNWKWFLHDESFSLSTDRDETGVSKSLWVLIAGSLLIWTAFLPSTQSEQAHRWKIEKLIEAQDYAELGKASREVEESEVPPHWDLPPRPGYGENEPRISMMLMGLKENNAANWMVQRYKEKLEQIESSYFGYQVYELHLMSDAELSRFVDIMPSLDLGSEFAGRVAHELVFERGAGVEILPNDPIAGLSDSRKASFQRIQKMAGEHAVDLDYAK